MVGPGDGGSEVPHDTSADMAAAFDVPPGLTRGTEPAPAGTTRGPLLRRLPPRPAEAQQEQPEGEILLGRMERVLGGVRVFGGSVADFALRTGAKGALRYGARELAKNIYSVAIGLGAGVGAGTAPLGAFTGAVAGTVVEYARQINRNLDQRLATAQEADPELVGRKQIFLKKIEGLRHKEAYKADFRKLGKAAFFGAVVGAGAGALVEHIPQIAEFIGEHIPGVARIGDIAGDIGRATGEAAGNASRAIGDVTGNIEHTDIGKAVGEAAGTAGRTIGDTAGGVGHALSDAGAREMAGNIPGAEYPDLGGVSPISPPDLAAVAGSVGQAAHETLGDASALATAAGEAKEHALGALTSNHEFLQSTAAAVGEQIDQSNLAVDEAIRLAGMDPSQLSSEAYENIRMSVQHRMEGLANEAFNHAAGAADNLDPSHLAEIAKHGHDEFVNSLSGTDTHQQLLKSASEALTEHLTAVEQAIAHAQSALDNFGNYIPLSAGSNPWEVSAGILKQMGVVNPSPEQIMQLNKIICLESGINVPEWGIPGTIDAHKLPVGFNINLTDAVKKIALGIASKK